MIDMLTGGSRFGAAPPLSITNQIEQDNNAFDRLKTLSFESSCLGVGWATAHKKNNKGRTVFSRIL